MVIWLIGDLCNLVGAALGGLLPTVIILALYVSFTPNSPITSMNTLHLQYSLCDFILLGQIYYYRWKRGRLSSENEPLLADAHRPQATGSTALLLLRYTGALLFVFAVGVVAWWIGSVPQDEAPAPPQDDPRWDVQVLGWASAVAYVCISPLL